MWRRCRRRALAALAVAGFPALDLWVEATQYVERNAYADYRIVQLEDGGRMLDVSGQSASRHDAEGKGWDYAERLERTLCKAGEMPALVLGAAGMTLGKGAPCALDVTFVDIDPAQERIAALFLDAPPETAGTFADADARAYLRRDLGGWPAIIVDTYSNHRTLPQHLLTVEFYRLARSRLLRRRQGDLLRCRAPGRPRPLAALTRLPLRRQQPRGPLSVTASPR